MTDIKTARPGRDGKALVSAWIKREGVFAFQELLLKLSRERGTRVTMQEAVVEALNDYLRKHGTDTILE